MDRGTKRLAIIAGGLAGALLLVVGVWTASGRHAGTVPVIEADARPLRVKPDNPGGLQVAGANDEILSGDAGPQADKLLPPPEIPAPQALKNQQQASPASPAAQGASPPAQKVSVPQGASASAASAGPDRKAAAPGKPTPAAAGKSTQVQLAAFDNEQAALSEWQRLSKRMPDVLNGRQPAVLKAERDGRAIWRLRTGGFSDVAQATAFCERVRAKGAGCSLASF